MRSKLAWCLTHDYPNVIAPSQIIISSSQIIQSFLAPFLGMTIIWVVAMLIIRSIYFEKNGARKTNKTPDENDRKKQLEHYNNAVYKVSEFYVKMMLALLGGMSFIAINIKENNATIIKFLIQFSGMFFFIVTLFFCIISPRHFLVRKFPINGKYDNEFVTAFGAYAIAPTHLHNRENPRIG